MAYHSLRETDKQGIVIVFWMITMLLFLFFSCSWEKKEVVDISFDRDHSYTMRATDISTLISDSGVTRYKMETKEWLMFEEASEPYWFFPEKIHIEKFDTLFCVEASFDSDTAYYFSKKKLWKFVGNVKTLNLEGEQFETSLLFWDQNSEQIYSDQYICIKKGDFVNTGIGFEANQTLTQYRIYNSGAEIPIKDEVSDTIKVKNSPSM